MKKIKKALLSAVSAAVVLTVSVCSSFAFAQEVSAADNGVMRQKLTATIASKEMGLGLNLGNTMEAYDASNCESASYKWPPKIGSNQPSNYETCWGAPVTTQAMIDGMKEAGFNTVRIPVFWGNMMENDGTYTINKDYIARVGEIVDYCRNAGVYTVINIHHFDEFIIRRNSLEECKVIFNKLWTQIAEYFKDYSDYVIFEGFNEYLGGWQFEANGNKKELSDSEGYELTNELNQTFVDAVRSTGGNNAQRILIVSGYWTNIDLTTSSQFIVPKDTVENKLMVSVHYVDNSMYWTNKIGGTEWVNYSVNQCELLKRAFTDKGVPVFVGETTSVYPRSNFAKNATVTTSSEALDYMLRLITSYGFTPVLWDTTNNFYNRSSCTIKSSTDAKIISTLAEEIKVPELTDPTDPSDPTDPDPETYTVSGVVKVSDSDTSTDMTVTVVSPEGKETSVSVKSMGNYSIADLEAGTYTLKISGGKYVERTYEVTVTDGDLAMDVNLNPLGDINGDGKATTADVGMANSHAKGVKALEGYSFVCADVTEDGAITTSDVGVINSHAKSSHDIISINKIAPFLRIISKNVGF